MTPITLCYAGALGLLMAALSLRVPLRRLQLQAPWGDAEDLTLATRVRAFGNFIEYVPAILVLMALLELQQAPTLLLHLSGAALLLARLIHAASLWAGECPPWRRAGRAIGALGTWLVLITLSAAALALALSG